MGWILPAILTGLGVGGKLLGGSAQKGALGDAASTIAKGQQAGAKTLMDLYGETQRKLAPYQSLITPSLQQLSNLTFRPGGFAPGGVTAPTIPNLAVGGAAPDLMKSLMSAWGGSPNAMEGLTPEQKAAMGLTNVDTQIFGSGNPVVTGMLSKWNQNPSKNEATSGVNQLSTLVWNDLAPAVVAGKISPADAETIFNGWWSDWQNSMKSSGVDPRIIDSSLQSQGQYFQTFNNFLNAAKGGSKDFSAWPYIGSWPPKA